MGRKLEYHDRVKSATVAAFVLILCCFTAANAVAQINAAPPSVTSLGFGGRAINGAPPSVTSLGPRGYTPGFNPGFPTSRPFIGSNPNSAHHRHHDGSYYPWAGGYAVPYYGYYDNSDQSADDADADEYRGGPTIFDRRGPGYVPRPPADSYSDRAPAESAEAAPQEENAPSSEQPATVLVFKDGHTAEVENYAIVGGTLYDLSEGHRRKVPLSELDLDATAKQNDDRGVDFQLPGGSK